MVRLLGVISVGVGGQDGEKIPVETETEMNIDGEKQR
jgi:hypothetical protein